MTVQNENSQSQIDVAPTNVESQPLPFETQFLHSDIQMEEVDLLCNFPHPNFPTLNLEKQTSQTGDHLLPNLLDNQSLLQDTSSEFVHFSMPSISTNSVVVTTNTSIVIPSTSSIDISHQSISAVPSTTQLNSSQSLISDKVPSMTNSQPLTEEIPLTVDSQLEHLAVARAASEELIIVTALLGLSAGEIEERLPSEHAKGENESEKLGISSSQAKGEFVGTTLVGECEGVVS